MKKRFYITTFFYCFLNLFYGQVSNDDCTNALAITLDASGSACINSTTLDALTTTFTSHACWPTNQPIPDVWFSFVTTGANNVVTVTPNGTSPAQQMAVSLTNQPCGSGALSTCGIASTNTGAATANWTYQIGTTVWVNVGSIVTSGSFQICISSTTPPPTPGSSCATASIICNKNPFSVTSFPNNTNTLSPSCFGGTLQRPVFYQFTVGQSGTCAWTADPTGNVEYDWVMYDITNSCPTNSTNEFGCNFNYAGAQGAPIGMQAGSTTSCPIVTGPISAPGEFCPAITVTSGRTYLIIIDNYSDNGTGFNFTWGGTFTIAPESQFTATPTTSCSPPQSVSFTNNSVAAASQVWNFGNGNTSTASAPPAQTYTATGTYIVSLTTTSATGCQDVFTQNIIIGAPPTVSVPANPTVCGGQSIPASLFSSTPAGATFTWTNDNTATGIPASGSANIPAITAVNFGTTPINSVITVTPTLNGCVGIPSSFTVTVDPGVASEFTQITPICSGGNIALPLTSNNGITGTWSPAVNNVATTTYTFTPAAGQCANAATMEIIVTNGIPATFSPLSSICSGGNLVLPAASSEGFTGSWSPAISNTTSQTYTFTPDAGQCALAGTLTSTVNPLPILSAINNQTVCAGQSVNTINYSTATAGATINWTNNESTIGLASSGSGDITSFTGVNTGNNPLIATVVATPTANGCNGLPQTFSITVNPIPVLSSVGSQTVCAGQTVSGINFNSSVANSTINWTNSQSGIGVATTGNGNISSFTGTNGGTTSLTGNFTATPTVNGCTGLPQTFSVTVNPNPTGITAIPTNENCGLNDGTLTVSGATGGTAPYQFSVNNGNLSSPPLNLTNLSSGTYTINVIDANGCSDIETVNINNQPGPSADFIVGPQIVGGDTIDIGPSSAGYIYSYLWNYSSLNDSLNAVLINNSSSGNGVTYDWIVSTGTTSTTYTSSSDLNINVPGPSPIYVTLIVSNNNGLCKDTAKIVIEVKPFIYVPNVFSPNGDGVNDNFFLNYRGYKELNLIIYNRWGNKMYETTNPAVGWSGADTSEGTYFYIVTGKGIDNKDFEKSGYLTLIR